MNTCRLVQFCLLFCTALCASSVWGDFPALPSYDPFTLPHPASLYEGTIPARDITLQSVNIPHWKQVWDQARMAARQGLFAEAENLYESVLEENSALTTARKEYVYVLLRQDLFPQASRQLDLLLDTPTTEKKNLFLSQGVLTQGLQQYERSVELLRRLENNDLEQEKVILSALANGFYALNDKKKCFSVLERLLVLYPSPAVVLNFSLLAYELEKYSVALPYAFKITAENERFDLLLLAARILEKNRKSEEAVPLWQRMSQKFPRYSEANERLAHYYESRGDFNNALQYLTLLKGEAPSSELLKRLAQAYMALHQSSAARTTLEAYRLEHPEDKEVLRSLIQVYASLGDKENTLATLQRYLAIADHPETEKIRKAAALYDEQGFYREAIPLYKKLLALSPDDPDLLRSLANSLLALGRDEDSLEVWQQLAVVAPDVVNVYRTMADLLRRLGRVGELVRVLEVIRSLDPADTKVVFELAEFAYRREDFATCRTLLDQFSPGQKQTTEFFLWQGGVYESEKAYVEALAMFKKVLERQPGNHDLRMRCIALAGKIGAGDFLKEAVDYQRLHAIELKANEALVLAQAFMHSRLFDEALEWFQNVHGRVVYGAGKEEGDPKHGAHQEIACGMADSFAGRGQPYEAEQVLRQFLATSEGGDQATVLLRLVHFALAEKRLSAAGYWLDLLQKSSPRLDLSGRIMQVRLAMAQDEDEGRSMAADLFAEYMNGEQQAANVLQKTARLEFLHLLMQLELYQKADRLGRHLLQSGLDDLAVSALMRRLFMASGGRFGMEKMPDITDRSLVELRLYADFLFYLGWYEDLGEVVRLVLEKQPKLFWANDFLLKTQIHEEHWREAQESVERMVQETPENSSLLLTQAGIVFHLGKIDEASRLVEHIIDDSYRSEILELKGRILWVRQQYDAAIELYESFLTPTVDQILQEKAVELHVTLPPREDTRSVWDMISFIPNEGNSVSSEVLAPDYFGTLHGDIWKKMRVLALGQYARYRWQEKFAEEVRARRSIKRREYFLAAKQYERLAQRYPENDSILYDLSGVYRHLERLGDEAAIYERLQEHQAFFPGLEERLERNRLKQRPFLQVDVDYDKREGRLGAVNMERTSYELQAWYNWRPRVDLSLSGRRLHYKAPDQTYSATGNRLMGSVVYRPWAGVSAAFSLGVHDVADRSNSTIVSRGLLEGKVGDKLSGKVAMSRELVEDTVASVLRQIERDSFETGVTLDLLPRLEVGGDYTYENYSDNNWTTGYDVRSAYTFFSDPTFLQVRYNYDFKESQEGVDLTGPVLNDGFAANDHPYWAPRNYWQNSFGVFFKHTLGDGQLSRGTPHYYSLEYLFGHDSDGYPFQELLGGLSYEFRSGVLLKGDCHFVTSQQYRQKKLSLSVKYRW